MRTIYKYELDVLDQVVIDIPLGSKPLCVQEQRGGLCLWVEVPDAAAEVVKRILYIFGTGNPIPERFNEPYIGTVQLGSLVWHVYGVL